MIGAHVGELTAGEADDFVRQAHAGRARRPSWSTRGRRPRQALREELMRRGVRLRSFTEFQGLLDLSGYVAEQTARLHRRPPLPARACTSRSATASSTGPATRSGMG